MSVPTTSELFAQASGVLAAGVSAAMRLSTYLDQPLYIQRGEGPYLYGIDGKRYIDFNLSNGATLLGHDHPAVKAALHEGVELGVICAAETPFHTALAARLVEIIPAAERVRYSSVGSEVTLVALRIARAATGRTKYLKFDGHFHGLTEPWLFKRANPLSDDYSCIPSSTGVPASMGDDVVMVPWNDVAAFEHIMREQGDQLAAVFCEPIHYNAGCIPPEPGFLQLLRDRTREHGTVLIFDEVLSGFRTALGGVSAETGIVPDLTTHAKAVANGLPLATVSGSAELMAQLMPTGGAVHSGTYSGHLLSVLAALATLDELGKPGVFDEIHRTADWFYAELQGVFDRAGVVARVQGRGARFGIYFGIDKPIRTWTDALGHDHDINRRFVQGCLDGGLYFHGFSRSGAPGHNGFSTAHTRADFDEALAVIESVAPSLRK